jgi:hypothetical protein
MGRHGWVRSTCSILVASSCFPRFMERILQDFDSTRQRRLQCFAKEVIVLFRSKVIHKNSPTFLPPRAYWDQPLAYATQTGRGYLLHLHENGQDRPTRSDAHAAGAVVADLDRIEEDLQQVCPLFAYQLLEACFSNRQHATSLRNTPTQCQARFSSLVELV